MKAWSATLAWIQSPPALDSAGASGSHIRFSASEEEEEEDEGGEAAPGATLSNTRAAAIAAEAAAYAARQPHQQHGPDLEGVYQDASSIVKYW